MYVVEFSSEIKVMHCACGLLLSGSHVYCGVLLYYTVQRHYPMKETLWLCLKSSLRRKKVYTCAFQTILYLHTMCGCVYSFADRVDLSVRKRKAPHDDDLALQNAAKRAKDSTVIV